MELIRTRIHFGKGSRRGNHLTPIKGPNSSFLSLQSNNFQVTIDNQAVQVFRMTSDRSRLLNNLNQQAQSYNIRIKNSESDSELFKEFESQDRKDASDLVEEEGGILSAIRTDVQIGKPLKAPLVMKITPEILKKRMGNAQMKGLSRQSMIRRLSSEKEKDPSQAITNVFQELNQLASKGQHSDPKRMAEMVDDKVKKTLGLKFATVIEDSLQQMVAKTSNKEEIKNKICSSLLISGLTIIRIYHELQPYLKDEVVNPFKLMNGINQSIFSYLKSKYPRAKNLFVPYEINKRFQQINFLTLSENNMMMNAGFTFTDNSATRKETITKIKKFFNKLLTECDDCYPGFVDLMNKKAFTLKNQSDMAKVKIKIGRKMQEDTEKYHNFQNDNMEITSPQLFRVMIKWIGEMERLLSQPSSIISKRKGIRCVKVDYKGKPIFSEIRSKRFTEIKVELIEKISDSKEYEKEMTNLINVLDQFNNNLTKTLNARECGSSFIKEEDAECLKFAKFNTGFLEWLIVEKILITIKILSNLSALFQRKFFKKLDFINFNVYDLMRASFSGKRNEIFQVFQNMKQLESQGEISIVRLKNRMSTPLNDVLINFKIKESFIICQLQLILSDAIQDGEDKLKAMEDLNHIIYELERSPYGPLSEMALTLGYHDPSIAYEKNISFKRDWFKEEICSNSQLHDFQEVYDQTTPFVCSWCVKFYGRLENFFQHHQCLNCSLKKCKACVFKGDNDQERRTYLKYFVSTFQGISLDEIDNEDDDFVMNFFENKTPFLLYNYIRVRDQIEMAGKVKLNKIQKLLYHKQVEYGLRGSEAFFCFLLHFGDGQCSIQILKYIDYNVFLCGKTPQYENNFKIQQYDVVFFIKAKAFTANSQTAQYGLVKVLSEDLKSELYDITQKAKVKVKAENSKVVYIKYEKNRYLIDIYKSGFTKNSKEAQINIKKATEKTIKACQAYSSSRKEISLDNIGLESQHLDIIKEKSWCSQVLVLNISYNRISQIPCLLDSFVNLQELYLANNQLSSLYIGDSANNTLSILDCSYNRLQEIPESINNCEMLTVLTADNNKITQIPKFRLHKLEELDLDNNHLSHFQSIFQSEISQLIIMEISENKGSDASWIMLLKMPNLRRIVMKGMGFVLQENKKLCFKQMPNLEYIDFSQNKIEIIEPLITKNVAEVRLMRNKIQTIEKVFTNKLLSLTLLDLEANQIEEFPILDLAELLYLNLSQNKIKFLTNINKCSLNNLQTLYLQNNNLEEIGELTDTSFPSVKEIDLHNNKISVVPKLSFPELQKLDLRENQIVDINQIGEGEMPTLSQLLLRDNRIKKIPELNLKGLKEFSFSKNHIDDLNSMTEVMLPEITTLVLWNNRLKDIPQINCPTLTKIFLYSNKIKDISQLASSKIQSIQTISLYENSIEQLPIFTFPELQKIYLYRNKISQIQTMSKWDTPRLRLVQLSRNKIQLIPQLKFKQLNTLELGINIITDISWLETSELPALKNLYLNKNKIQIVPPLMFKNLENLEMNDNKIGSIIQFIQKSRLPNLKDLFLNNNQIPEIPPEFNFPLLEELSLRKNKLTKFHVSNDKAFKKLQKLYLTDNQIEFFDFTLIELSRTMYQISLTRNPIKKWEYSEQAHIRKLFIVECGIVEIQSLYLPYLEDLSLQRNKLERIGFVTEPGAMSSLEKLNIERNELKQLPKFDTPKLKELFLFHNPIEFLENFLESYLPRILLIKLEAGGTNLLSSSVPISQRNDYTEIVDSNISTRQGNQEWQVAQGDGLQSIENVSPLKRKQSSLRTEGQREEIIRQLREKFPNAKIIA